MRRSFDRAIFPSGKYHMRFLNTIESPCVYVLTSSA